MLTPESLAALRLTVEGYATAVFAGAVPCPDGTIDLIKDAREALAILTMDANSWQPPSDDETVDLSDEAWDKIPF